MSSTRHLPLSPPEIQSAVAVEQQTRQAREAVGKRLDRIRHKAATGCSTRALCDLHLRSRGSRLVALSDARKALTRSVNRSRRRQRLPPISSSNIANDQLLLRMVEEFDLWTPCREPAFSSYVDKADGGRREVINFGLMNRARQLLLKMVLDALSFESSGQYTRKGRRVACADLKRALLDGNFKWVVLADVQNHFGSISLEQIASLGLLTPGVLPNLMLEAYNIVPRRGSSRSRRPLVNGGSRGIPQGSSVSPIVASLTLKPLVQAVEGECRFLCNYADNFLALADTRREADMIQNTLSEAARHRCVSHLDLHHLQIKRLDHGFEFLGYHFTKRRGRVRVRPLSKSIDEFNYICRLLIALDRPIEDVRIYVNGWCSQFDLADDVEVMRDHAIRQASIRQRLPDGLRRIACTADLLQIFKQYDRKKLRAAQRFPRDRALQSYRAGTFAERLAGWLQTQLGTDGIASVREVHDTLAS